jgi:hypothetical protein
MMGTYRWGSCFSKIDHLPPLEQFHVGALRQPHTAVREVTGAASTGVVTGTRRVTIPCKGSDNGVTRCYQDIAFTLKRPYASYNTFRKVHEL